MMKNLIFTDLTTASYAKLIDLIISKSKPKLVVVIGYNRFKRYLKKPIDTEIVFIDMTSIDTPIHLDDDNLPFDYELYEKFISLPYLLKQSFIRLGSRYSDLELVDNMTIKYFKFFYSLISKYSIGTYISFSVPHFPGEISLYSLIELKGENNLFFWGSGLNNIVFVSNNIIKIIDTDIKFGKSNTNALERELNIIINKSTDTVQLTPNYMRNIKFKIIKLRTQSFINRLILLFRRNESIYMLLVSFLNKRNSLLGPNYLRLYKKNCSKTAPKRDFVYLPLHMQPEATSIPLGGSMSNYLILLSHLLNSIPESLIILIKENPKQTYRQRNMELYKLLKHERIIFVCDDVNTYDLINQSVAVISITGTVLFESALLKKRAILLGSSIYSLLPNIIEVEELENYEKWRELDYDLSHSSFSKYMEFLEFSSIDSPVISNPYLDYENNIIDNTAEQIYDLLERTQFHRKINNI